MMFERSDYITYADFQFKDRFIGLDETQFAQALQLVNAQFSGVYTLWGILPPDERLAKRRLCVNYLLAWKLTDMYPETSVAAAGSGGMPLAMKKAGPLMVKYKTSIRQSGALEMLETNNYGINALALIQSAPESFTMFA